jgi:hypothetical protein
MPIRLAHPEIDDAIKEGAEVVWVGGAEMNPLAIHELVATQTPAAAPPIGPLRRPCGGEPGAARAR